MKWKVFVSSVVRKYEDFRKAAQDAIECLGHEAMLMEGHPASPSSSQITCLEGVESSDVVVLLMGSCYGAVQSSGMSATHEEWEHARSIKRKVLVFVEDVPSRAPKQQAFLKRVEDWAEGHHREKFSTTEDLLLKIVKALRALEKSASAVEADPVDRLPPNCQQRIVALRKVSMRTAERVVSWLSDPASRTPGPLARLIQDPPSWLVEGDALAWEAILDFMDAHDLPGSEMALRTLLEAGSPRSSLYVIRLAVSVAEKEKRARADGLLCHVPRGFPLLTAARARVAADAQGVVESVNSARLTKSGDTDLALYATTMLTWAYLHLEQFDKAVAALRETNERFPGQAWLLLRQSQCLHARASQIGLDSARGRDLLTRACNLAVTARDCFRVWDGPSHYAVDLATKIWNLLEDPHRVIDLASPPPIGEATASEADNPNVRKNLANAQLTLGQHDNIDHMVLEGLDPFERALIRGLKAYSSGDPAAPALLRRAMALANNDSSRRRALMGLAMVGEVDAHALSMVSDADAALVRGVAALNQENAPEAINLLQPYWLESSYHAHYLADARHGMGNGDEAVMTLVDAFEHLGDISLYEHAASLRAQQGRLDSAESLATEALALGPPRLVRHRLQVMLVRIAEQVRNWPRMESYAQTLATDPPQDEWPAWMVVLALHQQGKDRQAWGYLVGRNLKPFDELTALLAIKVFRRVDSPEQTERLLELAERYIESEDLAGYALSTLMLKGDRVGLDEDQRIHLQELIETFLGLHSQSDLLRRISAKGPEELVEVMTDMVKAGSEGVDALLEQVRYGLRPYGTLLWARPDLTYAGVLLDLGAGWLTAISAEYQQRERERQAVRRALGGKVTVDTSVIALGLAAGIDVNRLGDSFKGVLVADELIIDARVTLSKAYDPVAATVRYDPVLDRPIITEIDESHRQSAIEKCRALLATLRNWQRVSSLNLPAPLNLGQNEEFFRPWDASLRVAHSSEEVALWSDDLALRNMAEAEGIPAFGTWALCQVLSSAQQGNWLPPPTELKKRLLRARIADVPITIGEMGQALDDIEGPDVAAGFFLIRPHTWTEDQSEIYYWYLKRVKTMNRCPHRQDIPGLLYAACYGWCAATFPEDRTPLIGGVLATTLLTVRDPEMTPALLAASRLAAHELNPSAKPDPLPHAAQHMVQILRAEADSTPLSQTLNHLFSQTSSADQQTIRDRISGTE